MTEKTFTLRYQSTRGEIWRWYWKRWATTFWRIWLRLSLIVITVSLVMAWYDHHRIVLSDFTVPLFLMAAAGLLFTVYPQIAFKSEQRTLLVDRAGIQTTIGKIVGQRAWAEISSIVDENGVIALIVVKTGNAFLIPNRAFSDASERDSFLKHVSEWHRTSML